MEVTNNQKTIGNWPYNVWNSITLTFAPVFSEDDAGSFEIKDKKLFQLLDHIPEHSKCLVPVSDVYSVEYKNISNDCECFNIWLFGQLVAVYLHDRFESQRTKCLQAQMTLLRYICENDFELYRVIFNCYYIMFGDSVRLLGKHENGFHRSYVFKWFQFVSSDKLNLSHIEYKISSHSQLVDCLNFTITVLVSQTGSISNFCPSITMEFWNFSLILLKSQAERISTISVYKFVNYLINETSSLFSFRFNAVLSDLFLHLLDEIRILCQNGKLPDENGFCSTLNAISDRIDCYQFFDFLFVQILYVSLSQCSVPISEQSEKVVLKFFSKILQSCDPDMTSGLLQNKVHSSNIHVLMVLMRISIRDTICQATIQRKHSKIVNLQNSNEHWRYLITKMLELFRDNSVKRIRSLNTLHSITQLCVEVCREFSISVVFFESRHVMYVLDSLIEVFNSDPTKETLTVVLQIVRDLLILDEANQYDPNVQMTLQSLLTMSWLPERYHKLPTVFFQRYSQCVDDQIKENCIASLMTAAYRFEFDKWRDQFFEEIFVNFSESYLFCLPFLIYSMNDFDRELLMNKISSLDADILTEISFNISPIICALDCRTSCSLISSPKLRLKCFKCEFITQDTEKNRHRAERLSTVVVKVLVSSENAKYNVLNSLIKLFNHISKSEELLVQLRRCFIATDSRIRKKIIEVTPYIIFEDPSVTDFVKFEEEISRSFMTCFHPTVLEALAAEDADTQYVCLGAVLKIGCVPLEQTLLPCIIILLNLMMNASSSFAPLAKFYAQQIIMSHKMQTEEHVYLKYREVICPLVAELLVINFSTYRISLNNLPCDCSSIITPRTVLYILPFLLPRVARKPELRPIIDELAEFCHLDAPHMLKNAFIYVWPHVMVFEDSEICQYIMKNLYNDKLEDLLSRCITKVLAELFIHYEELEVRVKWSLSEIKILVSPSIPDPSKVLVSDSSIEGVVQSKFFGVLMKLEDQLGRDIFCDASRKRVLSSFKSLIHFMNPSYITSVRFKVLCSLRTITEKEKNRFPSVCIDIWDIFVRKVNSNSFGPIMSTIFVSLLPFTDTFKQRVNNIFRYVLSECVKSSGEEHVLELYFLEERQCDPDIYRQILKATNTLSSYILEVRLEWLLKASQHEVTEIKLHALRRLKRELADNRKHISALILASDSVNRLVFSLLDVLIDGFRNLDPSIQRASGICLGEFAALDPSYIPNVVIKEEVLKKYKCYEIDDSEFVVQAFTLLSQGFQMARSSANMDTFALAIQFLLKAYNVTQTENCPYWKRIPEQLRHIIKPFHSTAYILRKNSETAREIPHLVYGLRQNLTVQTWAYNWSTFLISLLPADSKAKEVFTYCKGPMSCEFQCMYFFLPHILLQAVLSSEDENIGKICEEMISVVRQDPSSMSGVSNVASAREQTSTQLMISEELSVISNDDLEMGVICSKTIFKLLDVVNKKFRDMRSTNRGKLNGEAIRLRKFLNKFSKLQLAQKSFDKKEYVRSLLYLEEYLENVQKFDDTQLALLAKIYFHLNDVDNVRGLFTKYVTKLYQLQNVIMLHEITDQFQDAAICYQQLLKNTADLDEERALFYEKRIVQCYLATNQPETALCLVKSLSSAQTKHSFNDVECEALWNLSQFDKLDHLTSNQTASIDENWGVRIGQSLVHLLKDNRDGLSHELSTILSTLTKSLHMATVASGSYRDCYEHTVKLHILNEFEKVAALVYSIADAPAASCLELKNKFNKVIKGEFEERLRKLQPTSKVLQPVLNMRQVLFTVAANRLQLEKKEFSELFRQEIRHCWLKAFEMANRTRNFQLAYSKIVAIDLHQVKGLFIEKAKYYWEKIEQQEALRTLQGGLQIHYPDYQQQTKKPAWNDEDRKTCAESLMLLGMYNDATADSDPVVNLRNFHKAYVICPDWEKALVKFAQYHEKVICVDNIFQQPEQCLQILQCYGESLKFGCEFIYQSLSRMLNIWLDLAECWYRDSKNKDESIAGLKEKRKQNLDRMIVLIRKLLQSLPTYYFLTAFTLILSRMMHPVSQCFDLLEAIINKCILIYPNQALWQFMAMCEPRSRTSENAKIRTQRANRVLSSSDLVTLNSTISKFRELFQDFSSLCASKARYPGDTTVAVLAPNNGRLLKDDYFKDILIPAQKFLTIVLPRSASSSTYSQAVGNVISSQVRNHNPFPETMVYIKKVENKAKVYSSLQKPVLVSFLGTDGKSYRIIFKASDDLRIDSVAMEFNAVVNMYLKRDAEARDRALIIRTYTVLPLFGTNGIIEFIPNLDSMRNVCIQMRRSLGMPQVQIKEYQCAKEDPIEKKRDNFRTLLKLFPPILHEWYKMEFPNPNSWYTARTSYVRTLAVMSVVGYILGLGDRHNDNILLDLTNGDIVHVDFNALFNKGETLPYPERVPFRLTLNMIKTMGPLGYEGSFKYTCEIVNRVIRSKKDQLISVFNTFLYDPPDSLAEGVSRSKKSAPPAVIHEMAAKKVKDVEARMNGVVRAGLKKESVPLSVEGQIKKLIEEAVDEDNLCQMFQGWAAHL